MNEDHTQTPAETTASGNATRPARSWLLRGGTVLVLMAGLGAAAAVASEVRGGQGFGPGFAMGDGGGERMRAQHARWGGHHGFGPMGMIDHVLDEIDATDEQRDQIEDIIDEARDEVRPLMRDFRDSREEFAGLITGETVDAAAVEAFRAERLAAIDQASKTMSAALVEAAQVLSAEQRAELAEQMEERHGRRW